MRAVEFLDDDLGDVGCRIRPGPGVAARHHAMLDWLFRTMDSMVSASHVIGRRYVRLANVFNLFGSLPGGRWLTGLGLKRPELS
jgi:hypothetical protein